MPIHHLNSNTIRPAVPAATRVMCTKIRDNKRQNNNFIHIAIKKRTAIHPATMFRIASASGLKQIITPAQRTLPATTTVHQIMSTAVGCPTKNISSSISTPCTPINRPICVQ